MRALTSNRRVRDVAELGGSVVLGLLVAVIGLAVIHRVGWPAFNTSNVTRALTTAGQAVAIVLVVIAIVAARYGAPASRAERTGRIGAAPGAERAGRIVGRRTWTSWLASIGSAAMVTVTLGMPLGATSLYLHGLSGDQQFRTEYLTRMTSSPRLADMTYIDLPPFYPAGWFWFGGRYANLAGMPGWEAYQGWAIISMAIAAALGTALWCRMVGVGLGAAVGLAVTTVTLIYASPEPYAACLILVGVPMLVVIAGALRGRGRLADGPRRLAETNWLAVLAGGVFLGVSATVYTLYTALFAGTAVLLALGYAVLGWRAAANKSVPGGAVRAERLAVVGGTGIRLLVMGVIAIVIALAFWAPYLWYSLTSDAASQRGTAEHYLPEGGALFGLPFFRWSLVSLLLLIGLIWVVLRARTRTLAVALGTAFVAAILMTFASLALTAAGTTLLSFRLEAVTAALFAAAGVFGVAELARATVGRLGDVRTAIGIVALVCAVAVAQSIPGTLSSEITMAYTDTDGNGVRADHHEPDATSYFRAIDHTIRDQTGRAPEDSVVLTADFTFLSIYPYWGFQGLTSHYANPLAEFDRRAAAIKQWSEATTPGELLRMLDKSPWRAPDVFLFRHGADGSYTLRLAEDVYPNDPNVRRYTVSFDPAAFDDPAVFTVTTDGLGPFVLVVKNPRPFQLLDEG